MVEENGSVDPLAPSPDPPNVSVGVTNTQPHLVAATNIVHLTLPTQTQGQAQVGDFTPPKLCNSFACSSHKSFRCYSVV